VECTTAKHALLMKTQVEFLLHPGRVSQMSAVDFAMRLLSK
jgi:hypothetical protein